MDKAELSKLKFQRYESTFDESKLYSPHHEDSHGATIKDFRRKLFGYKKYYSDLVFLRTKVILEQITDFQHLRKELLGIIKSILRIDKCSFQYIDEQSENGLYEWKTDCDFQRPDRDQVKNDIGNLFDELELEKLTHVENLVGTYPFLEEITQKYSSRIIKKIFLIFFKSTIFTLQKMLLLLSLFFQKLIFCNKNNIFITRNFFHKK